MDKMNKEEINELTHKIIGCAMQVHRVLGNGFQEVIYQRSLAIEFRYAGLEFGEVTNFKSYVFQVTDLKHQGVDFFVEEKVMVEIKAI